MPPFALKDLIVEGSLVTMFQYSTWSVRAAVLLAISLWADVSMATEPSPSDVSGFVTRESSDNSALRTLFSLTLAENGTVVAEQSSRLSSDQRYDVLRNWVMPLSRHDSFRVNGQQMPLGERLPEAVSAGSASRQPHAEIISPVFELLDVARETGRLDDLHAQVVAVRSKSSSEQSISTLALEAMIELERGRQESAAERVEELLSAMRQHPPVEMADVWPATLLAYRCLHQREDAATAEGVVSFLLSTERQWAPPGPWRTQIRALAERLRCLQLGGDNDSFERPGMLRDWIPVSLSHSSDDMLGHAPAHTRWHRDPDGEPAHQAGHYLDYLFLRSPLQGEFSIEGEVTNETQVHATGQFVGPHADLTRFYSGVFRVGASANPLPKPFTMLTEWNRFRVVHSERQCSTFLNGRLVSRIDIAKGGDPWVGFRSLWGTGHGFRNIRFTGTPEIPESVRLSEHANLAGWVPWNPETINVPQATWNFREGPDGVGEIVGMRQPWRQGSRFNSLLYYHRPLAEDGSVEYEFFYQPGQAHTHPALGRIAFLITPRAVFPHWIVGVPDDHSNLSPDNSLPGFGRVTASDGIPLRAGQWNRLRLSVVGETMLLELNDQPIFEAPINSSGNRTFGLFHFAENTEVRVRNVVMRGDWPRSIRASNELEFGDHTLAELDSTAARLSDSFEHDFAADAIPDEHFMIRAAGGSTVSHDASGVRTGVTTTNNGERSELALRLELHGDFDVEAEFDNLEITGDEYSCILMEVSLADARKSTVRLLRMRDNEQRQIVFQQTSAIRDRQWVLESGPLAGCEATTGRLRICRRGDKVHFLVSDTIDGGFQHVGVHTMPAGRTAINGVALQTSCGKNSTASVCWRRLHVRAERIQTPRQIIARLDQERSELTEVFQHDFAKDGLPDDRFRFISRDWIEATPEGALARVKVDDGLAGGHLIPNVDVKGDFDMEASFEQLKLTAGRNATILLRADPQGFREVRTMRTLEPPRDFIRGSTWQRGREQVYGEEQSTIVTSASGRLRLVRRGSEIFSLYSPRATGDYFLIGHRQLEGSETPVRSLRLTAFADSNASTTVLWKSLSVRANSSTD